MENCGTELLEGQSYFTSTLAFKAQIIFFITG
jgi:hypothetical protein